MTAFRKQLSLQLFEATAVRFTWWPVSITIVSTCVACLKGTYIFSKKQVALQQLFQRLHLHILIAFISVCNLTFIFSRR
jgi:hypothetical protein